MLWVDRKYFSGDFERAPDWEITSILRIERSDSKARGNVEDLEPRESWQPNWENRNFGELKVVWSLSIQGLFAGVVFALSWGPRFAVVHWMSGGSY